MADIQETIARLRELDRTASPAPWWVSDSDAKPWHHGILCEYGESPEVVIDAYWDGARIDDNSPDLHLIAEARNAVPVLLTEIDRLTARLSISEARLSRVAANHPDAYLAASEGDKE